MSDGIVKTIVLILVLHFISDFNLQIGARLHEMKQRSWWKAQLEKCQDFGRRKYRYDWICALLIHSFVWSVITFAPILWTMESGFAVVACIAANTGFHAFIDNAKANELAINLIEDQMLHFRSKRFSRAVGEE